MLMKLIRSTWKRARKPDADIYLLVLLFAAEQNEKRGKMAKFAALPSMTRDERKHRMNSFNKTLFLLYLE